MKIAEIGLGKLGLPLVAFIASKGHNVIGIDNNKEFVKCLNNGVCSIKETGLLQLLDKVSDSIKYSSNIKDAFDTDIAFIIVPTPSMSNGFFSNDYLDKALESLNGYKGLVVITSTVMPHTCENIKGFRLCYNPEFIALGSVLHDLEYPDNILIGENNKEDGDLLEKFHDSLHGYKIPTHRMSLVNAEIAKLALNCYVTTKITFANQLAQICENINGGNIDKITKFLGDDTRIGGKYLKGGLGFAGPCFPRDNEAFMAIFGEYNLQKEIINFNNSIPKRVELIARYILLDLKNPEIVMLGTSYKPNTGITERSQSLEVAKLLNAKTYDPSVNNCDIKDVLNNADLCIIGTQWDCFKKIDLSTMRHKRVLDCWRMMENKNDCDMYIALGIN
jgi:UDPglucose 6-dehydrogenase